MKIVIISSVIFVNLGISSKCLLSTVSNSNEYIYWKYVIICMFLKISLQESLDLVFVMILMILFWNINTFLV